MHRSYLLSKSRTRYSHEVCPAADLGLDGLCHRHSRGTQLVPPLHPSHSPCKRRFAATAHLPLDFLHSASGPAETLRWAQGKIPPFSGPALDIPQRRSAAWYVLVPRALPASTQQRQGATMGPRLFSDGIGREWDRGLRWGTFAAAKLLATRLSSLGNKAAAYRTLGPLFMGHDDKFRGD